ncbi:HIT family protein [Sneathiella limimaris]|uniref:HIT family protein n=1 Tax=Sneathiella limimaris TaxID=1964213 RepID=UPI00146D18AD|nr:HIT family protein [Sneathiella limimaris]
MQGKESLLFNLHPQLANDTVTLGTYGISKLLLMKDARYPWLILVPMRQGLTELHELTASDYDDVADAIRALSDKVKSLFQADKINVGMLGNLVPQLHIHIIARNQSDPAWPGPVWGQGKAVPYEDKALIQRIDLISNHLKLN